MCVCVYVCQCVQVCVNVILHNPSPSVMTVITSPSLHISDSTPTHRMKAAKTVTQVLDPHHQDYITLHYFTLASLSLCGETLSVAL